MYLETGDQRYHPVDCSLYTTALPESVRKKVNDVYYRARSNELVRKLSPELCRRAKNAEKCVLITNEAQDGTRVLEGSLNDVCTAIAVPVYHQASNTNVILIYYSLRQIVFEPGLFEFLIHLSYAAAVKYLKIFGARGEDDSLNAAEC